MCQVMWARGIEVTGEIGIDDQLRFPGQDPCHHRGPKRETKAECTMGELDLWSLGMEEEGRSASRS